MTAVAGNLVWLEKTEQGVGRDVREVPRWQVK